MSGQTWRSQASRTLAVKVNFLEHNKLLFHNPHTVDGLKMIVDKKNFVMTMDDLAHLQELVAGWISAAKLNGCFFVAVNKKDVEKYQNIFESDNPEDVFAAAKPNCLASAGNNKLLPFGEIFIHSCDCENVWKLFLDEIKMQTGKDLAWPMESSRPLGSKLWAAIIIDSGVGKDKIKSIFDPTFAPGVPKILIAKSLNCVPRNIPTLENIEVMDFCKGEWTKVKICKDPDFEDFAIDYKLMLSSATLSKSGAVPGSYKDQTTSKINYCNCANDGVQITQMSGRTLKRRAYRFRPKEQKYPPLETIYGNSTRNLGRRGLSRTVKGSMDNFGGQIRLRFSQLNLPYHHLHSLSCAAKVAKRKNAVMICDDSSHVTKLIHGVIKGLDLDEWCYVMTKNDDVEKYEKYFKKESVKVLTDADLLASGEPRLLCNGGVLVQPAGSLAVWNVHQDAVEQDEKKRKEREEFESAPPSKWPRIRYWAAVVIPVDVGMDELNSYFHSKFAPGVSCILYANNRKDVPTNVLAALGLSECDVMDFSVGKWGKLDRGGQFQALESDKDILSDEPALSNEDNMSSDESNHRFNWINCYKRPALASLSIIIFWWSLFNISVGRKNSEAQEIDWIHFCANAFKTALVMLYLWVCFSVVFSLK